MVGDRASIAIYEDDWPEDREPQEAVFLYTHYCGEEVPEIVRRALIRGRERWHSFDYLARIVADDLSAATGDSALGMGISTRLTDTEYDLLVLCCGRKERDWHPSVFRVYPHAYAETGFVDMDRFPNISFEDYVTAGVRTWDNLTDVLDRDACPALSDITAGDQVLVNIDAYANDGEGGDVWCEVVGIAPGSASVYPIKVDVPGYGQGQYKLIEVKGYKSGGGSDGA